jgi:hypothetical protein
VTLDEIPPGSLKLITAPDDPAIEAALLRHIRTEDVRRASATAWLAYTDAEPAQIRDWLTDALAVSAAIIVVEFERWSVMGDAVDPAWLLRRGH